MFMKLAIFIIVTVGSLTDFSWYKTMKSYLITMDQEKASDDGYFILIDSRTAQILCLFWHVSERQWETMSCMILMSFGRFWPFFFYRLLHSSHRQITTGGALTLFLYPNNRPRFFAAMSSIMSAANVKGEDFFLQFTQSSSHTCSHGKSKMSVYILSSLWNKK